VLRVLLLPCWWPAFDAWVAGAGSGCTRADGSGPGWPAAEAEAGAASASATPVKTTAEHRGAERIRRRVASRLPITARTSLVASPSVPNAPGLTGAKVRREKLICQQNVNKLTA
jgi:hypothetical protein